MAWDAKRFQKDIDSAIGTPKKKGNFVEDFNVLPTAGAIAGGGLAGLLALPSGPGAAVAAAAGGAAGAGLGEGLEQFLFKKFNPAGLAAETALGAAGGPLSKLLFAPVKAGAGIISGSSRKLVASGLKMSPAAFQKAADAGVDLIKSYQKFSPKLGIGLNKPLGDIAKGSTGNLGKLIQNEEKIIEGAINTSGATKRFSVGQLTDELYKHKEELGKIPGNEKNLANLDDFITEVTKRYSKGITPKELLGIKRAADSEFGRRVLDETVGSVEAQAQKVLANASRSLLKNTYKNIDEALGNEQELILLRDVLKGTRGKIESEGFKLSPFDFLQQGISAAGRTITPATGVLRREAPKAAINAADQAALRGPLSLLQGAAAGAENASNTQTEGVEAGAQGIASQEQELLNLLTQQQQQQTDRYPLENFMSDIQRDPQNYKMYADLYEMLNSEEKVSASAKNQQMAVSSAGAVVDQLESIFADLDQPESGLEARISGLFKKGQAAAGYNKRAKTYEAMRKGSASRVIRALGEVGVLTDVDVQRALGLMPEVTDSGEEAADKFMELRALLQAQMGGGGSQEDLLMQLLGGQ